MVLSMCVEQGLLAALGSHLFSWHREVRRQGEGLGIGSDLTRAVARLVMLDWDINFLQLARANHILYYLYHRYVDDTNNATAALAPGKRWSREEGRMVLHPHLVQEDLDTPADERTMREVVHLANSISNMVQFTGDCPSLNHSKKMPLLDLQVWVDGNKLLWEHYRKPMANPLVMMEISAMPAQMKRTALTQEVVRIQRNTRRGLPWETTVRHLNHFSERLKLSGYSQDYRFQIIQAGVKGYEKMVEVEDAGGRPVNKPRTWEEDLRQKKKELQKSSWYRKGGFHVPLFVPHTPGGELVRRMKQKEGENNQGRQVRFKIVGKAGVTLEQKLRKSNPWNGEKCGRARCFPCMGEGGGDCWREGVCYTLWCGDCGEMVAAYKGETGRNGYSRGAEHLDALDQRNEDMSVLWAHSVHHHQARVGVQYLMKVTTYHTDALDRQVRERVNISSFKGQFLMNRRTEMGGLRVERTQYRRWGVID